MGAPGREWTTATFTLTGADLSIASGRAPLVDPRSRFGGPPVRVAIYAFSFLLFGVALWTRRRADVDPAVIRRRKLLAEACRQIDRAATANQREGAEQVASAIRSMLAVVPSARTEAIDSFLADCEVVVYAPQSTGEGQVDRDLVRNAQEIARAIREGGS